jgi:hypothetical protein
MRLAAVWQCRTCHGGDCPPPGGTRAGASITDVRGTAFVRRADDASGKGWFEIDSTSVDEPGRVEAHVNPYQTTSEQAAGQGSTCEDEF